MVQSNTVPGLVVIPATWLARGDNKLVPSLDTWPGVVWRQYTNIVSERTKNQTFCY